LEVRFDAGSGLIEVIGIDDQDSQVDVNVSVISDKPTRRVSEIKLTDDDGNWLSALVEVSTGDGNRQLRVQGLEYSDIGSAIVGSNFYKVEHKTDPPHVAGATSKHIHQNLFSTSAEFIAKSSWNGGRDVSSLHIETTDELNTEIVGQALFSVVTNRGILELGLFVDEHRDIDADGLNNIDELLVTLTDPENSDTDGDGMADGWEILYGLDPLDPSDATLDPDGDMLTNLEEFQLTLDPNNPDTDGDTLTDGEEVLIHGTDPRRADTDGDGLNDAEELAFGSNPLREDSDADGLIDGAEPLWNGDSDGDGAMNALDPDSDNDGMPDGWEFDRELNPVFDDSGEDPDMDLAINLAEYQASTHPQRGDTDYDMVIDGMELVFDTDALQMDSDNDGVIDGFEKEWNEDSDHDGLINALDPDSDEDGLPDGLELDLGTDMALDDTDHDGLPDGSDPDPLDNPLDTDRDRLEDAVEASLGTDPLNPDTDNDGLSDGREPELGTNALDEDSVSAHSAESLPGRVLGSRGHS
jgi:hypothetical protein